MSDWERIFAAAKAGEKRENKRMMHQILVKNENGYD
jgi:hypothetical protein